jgi:transcriptional antiterminator NusG
MSLQNGADNISIPFKSEETIKVVDGPFNGFNSVIENK